MGANFQTPSEPVYTGLRALVEGATVMITPTVSEPIYFNPSVVPDVNQLTTSNDGGVLWPNVPPGEYVLSATHPTATFTTVDIRCEEGWVVNANPVWGLHAIDPSTVTTTTTTEVTTTTETTTASTGTSVAPTSIDAETTTSLLDDSSVTTTAASSSDDVSGFGSGGGRGSQPPQAGDLPRTGADPRQMALAAVVSLLGGSLLVALGHRQFRRS